MSVQASLTAAALLLAVLLILWCVDEGRDT